MRPEQNRREEISPDGKPMARATPRDVAHIRVGSFILVFLIAIGALGMISHAPVLTIIAGVLAVVTLVDILLAVRRQKNRGTEEVG